MLADVATVGLVGELKLLIFWRSEAEFDVVSTGGVAPPLAEAVELDFVATPASSLLESVLWLLFLVKLMLALERRRSSFRKAGDMAGLWRIVSLAACGRFTG